ncbi:DUF2125 domain-containing protein [Rhodobacteraceae bacterium KMM 6894]|nr:DUF2125 domain-containing protein [Rhodobacteraceae bacterium KMM 6894]
MNTPRYAGLMATATSLLMTSGAALADVTPAEVWTDWKGYMTGFGYTVTAEETQTGDSLTLTNMVLGIPMPETGGDVTMTLPELQFIDNGDGTVKITMPEVMPMKVDVTGSDPVAMELIYTTQGLDMNVSGTAGNMTWDYTAAMLGIKLGDLTAESETVNIGKAQVEFTDVTGQTVQEAGDTRRVNQTLNTGAVTYDFDFTDPDNADSRVVVNGGTDSLTMGVKMALPKDMDSEQMAAALHAGFAVDGGYTYGPGNMTFNVTDRGEVTEGTTSSQGGAFALAMDAGRLLYDVSTNQLDVEVASPELPFPVAMQMRKIAFKMLMPVSKDDAAQDFELSMELGDFTMSEMLWGIFDPAAQLPRDPATVALALSGKVKVLFDLMDPQQMEAVEDGDVLPGELDALSLNSLIVRAAGAELTGEGDFTFDNSDLTTYEGMPKPIGSVELHLMGGNGLLDKLVAMGLFSDDDAMGIRMMSAAFVKPGGGEDHMTSTIEMNAEGQILANGQRLK